MSGSGNVPDYSPELDSFLALDLEKLNSGDAIDKPVAIVHRSNIFMGPSTAAA